MYQRRSGIYAVLRCICYGKLLRYINDVARAQANGRLILALRDTYVRGAPPPIMCVSGIDAILLQATPGLR